MSVYWKSWLGVPFYKIRWYAKQYLYKLTGITLPKLKNQRKYWNIRGKEYFDEFFDSGYYRYEMFFQDMLIDELKRLDFDSFFEVGCGFGWNVSRVKRDFPDIRIGGVDFSFSQLFNGRYNWWYGFLVDQVQGDACNLPYKNNSFDVGFTMGVFMNIHPEKIEKVIDELIRVSGKYIIHLEWDKHRAPNELRKKREFKRNIISHDYLGLYAEREMKLLRIENYLDFGEAFKKRFPTTKVGTWEQFEGPGKYILLVVEV